LNPSGGWFHLLTFRADRGVRMRLPYTRRNPGLDPGSRCFAAVQKKRDPGSSPG